MEPRSRMLEYFMVAQNNATTLISDLDTSYSRLPRYVSYADEAGHSIDPNRNFLCLAGLLATESAWTVFDQEWRSACAEEGLTEPFHMMDFAALKGQFKGWSEDDDS